MRPSVAACCRSSSVRMSSSRYKRRHGLGSDALQVQQVQNRRRELGDQLAVIDRIAGLGDFENPRGEILPDAGDLTQARGVERRELMGMVGDDVGAVAIGANLERVVGLDLQEVGDLPEYPSDRQVIQPADLPSRYGSRALERPRP